MSEKYTLNNPSQELLKETIRNPPEDFVRFYVRFIADGIMEPDKGEDPTEYIKLCNEKNIIPFSSKEVKYDGDVKGRIPKNPEGARRFFGSGRTSIIHANISYDEELKRLKEIYIPSLLENNYHVDWGEFSFGDHRVGSHETEGIESDLLVLLGKKKLEMRIDENYVVPERIQKFEKWIKGLEEKF